MRFVIFPWLAFGHLLRCLELAERLASRRHRVSLVSTPGNIARLLTLRPGAAPRVDLVALPLPRVEGLPDGTEDTNSVPHGKRELLFKAFEGLAAPFAEFLGASCADESKRPDWVIVDSYFCAAAAVGHKVPCAMLLLASAASLLAQGPAAVLVPGLAAAPHYELEQRKQHHHVKYGASGVSITKRFHLTLERCTVVAMRSCPEWEPEFFPLMEPFVVRKPAIPLGLLPPSPDTNGSEKHDATLRWLDAQPASSVVYVALGSEVPLRVEQVRELPLGLELAGARFLWALRKLGGGGGGVVPDDDGVLPAGFRAVAGAGFRGCVFEIHRNL